MIGVQTGPGTTALTRILRSAKDYGLNNIHIYDTFGFAV